MKNKNEKTYKVEITLHKESGIELDKDIIEDMIHEYYNLPHECVLAKIISKTN